MDHHNLPLSIVVNRCIAIPKSRAIPIILVNTNVFNVWVWQSLLTAELHDADYDQIKHKAKIDWEGDKMKMRFQPYLMNLTPIII